MKYISFNNLIIKAAAWLNLTAWQQPLIFPYKHNQ